MNSEKQAKHNQVQEIIAKITSAKSIVVAEYLGLTVLELQELRNTLEEHNVDLKVYKNRLFKIAAKQAKIDLNDALIGPNIFAFGMEDDISAAKFLTQFAKTHHALKLKIGTYKGKVIKEQELAIIAALPTYEEALTILARSLLTPLQNIAVGLKMLIDKDELTSQKDKTTNDENSTTQQESAKASTPN